VEHLAALMVLSLIVGWLLVLNTYYRQQVVPLQQYAIAQQLALTALKAQLDQGTLTFANQKGQVVVHTTEVEVKLNGKTYHFQAPTSFHAD